MEQHPPKQEKCLYPVGAFSGITIDGKKIVAGTLRCNSWTCPVCQPILIKKLYKRILHGAIGKGATPKYGFKFLTLTFGGQDERQKIREMIAAHNQQNVEHLYYPEVVYDIMAKNFHKLIRALKKQYGNFHYFRVNELQKDGTPHFHVLLAGEAVIPKDILRAIEKKWTDLYNMGFVKINCVRFRDRKHAVRYMLKYITKDIKKPGKWKRLFTASRNALLKIQKPEWLAMSVYIGKVTDKGIREEKLTFDSYHGYCDVISQNVLHVLPTVDILKIISERHLKNLLVSQEA